MNKPDLDFFFVEDNYFHEGTQVDYSSSISFFHQKKKIVLRLIWNKIISTFLRKKNTKITTKK